MVLISDPDLGAPLQELPPLEGPAEDVVGGSAERPEEGRSASRSGASSRMSGAARRFCTTDVGRRVPNSAKAEEDVQSAVSEWELCERQEKEEERWPEAERVEAEAEEHRSSPPPLSWPQRRRSREQGGDFFCLFAMSFPWCALRYGNSPGGGQRGPATSHPRTDRGRRYNFKEGIKTDRRRNPKLTQFECTCTPAAALCGLQESEFWERWHEKEDTW